MKVKESSVDEPEKKKRKLIVNEKEQILSENTTKFDGSHFRKLIKGEHPLGALRQLIVIVKNGNENIISDFLNAGGSALEIIAVLDKLEAKTYYHHYQPVFSVLSLIIIKCRDEIPRLVPSTEEACRCVLRRNTAALHSMLASSSPQAHKKVVLEMLTVMVTLSVQVARDVLTSLSLREITMNDLAKNPIKYEPNSVRSHFIRYILSYFYHDSIHLIKQLLEQRHLLHCIILAGLTVDEASVTNLFLSILKEKIVENITISKTTKRKIFNTKIMMKLLEVYTWTGPNLQNKNINNDLKDDKDEVFGRLHQLMVLLCTNHKLGLAFVDPSVGLDQKNCNDLVFSVIKSMDPYWNVSLVRDLAVKTVLACPDLIAATFKHLGMQEFFNPDVTLSFVHTCEFSKEVIENLVPERCLVSTGSPDQLTHLTVRSVLNMNVLSCVRASLLSVHPTLRLHAISLLNAIFHTLKRFSTTVKAWFSASPKDFVDYQQRITDHITKNIGLEEELMVAWSLGVGGDQSLLKIPSETEYYIPLIDLLLSYTQVFPVYLPSVFISKLKTTSLDTIDSDTQDLFRVKIIKFITEFKSTQPDQAEFSEMINTLVPLLAKQHEAKSVLKKLLQQTGYFEGVESEVDIWVENLSMFPNCDFHLPLLLSTLEYVVSKPKRCLRILQEATAETEASNPSEFNWHDLINVAKNSTKILTPWRKMIPNSRISILLPAFLKVLSDGDVENLCSCKFVSHLLGDVLFCQVDQNPFQQLIDTCSSPIVEPMKKCIQNLSSPKAILKSQLFVKHSLNHRILKILSGNSFSEAEFLEITGLEVESLPQLIRLVVFCTVRLADIESVDLCSLVAHSLVERLPEMSPLRESCLEEVFLHPDVLQKFQPLQSPSPSNLTPVVISLIDLIGNQHLSFLQPFKQRFSEQLHKAVRKNKKLRTSNLPDICSKLITKEEVSALLSAVVEFQPGLEQCFELTSCLLQSAISHKCLLPGSVLTVLSKHTTLHESLVKYLALFPHLMDYLDTDHLLAKQDELSQLSRLVLSFDSEGMLLKRLLKRNKSNPKVLVPALVSCGRSCDETICGSIPTSAQADQLIHFVISSLNSNQLPDWLSENSEAIGKFLSKITDDQYESIYSSLQSVELPWTPELLDIAKPVYLKLGHVVNFVNKALQVLLPLTTSTTLTRAESICSDLQKVVTSSSETIYDWQAVRECDDWTKWVKLALKLGETPDNETSFLLTALSKLCRIVYSDKQKGVSTVTEMVLSHSQFLNIMLAKSSTTKTALLELLLTLLQLDSSVMVTTHIPILLSAYSASLSAADQLILQILQLYESQGLSLSEWKPYLWGEAAVSFYSVRSQISAGLWNKQNFNQLLDLFDEQTVNLTIAKFPIYRELEPKSKIDAQPEVFDPAFYLPMLVATFAPSEIFFTYKTCQSGCLSLVLSALASHHEDVRTVAFVALQRFHCHLISNTNNQDTLWLHFLDALRRGLNTEGDTIPRLSSVVAVFLARTAIILTNPSHPLYLPLSQFVLAKPRFHLDTVPEMLPLFNSPNTHLHATHQEWILSVLKDGLRDFQDFNLCLNSMVFKFIMDYFSSTLASERAKVLIIEVLTAAVRVKGAGSLLVSAYSLHPWLVSVVKKPTLPTCLLTPLISLLSGLLHKSSAPQLTPLLVQLTYHQLTEAQLTAVLATLAPYPQTIDTVRYLVDVVDNIVGGVFQHRTMLDNGVKYVQKNIITKDVHGYLRDIIFNLFENES